MAVHFISNLTQEEFLADTTRLYRFCSVEHALDMILKRRLWFANPVNWNDPFESRFLKAAYEYGDEKELAHPLRDRVLCMCLTGTYASEAFWRVYSENMHCLCLSIDNRKLFDVLDGQRNFDVYIGRVDYRLTQSIKKEKPAGIDMADMFRGDDRQRLDTALKLMMLKRVAFKYENEIRILLIPHRNHSVKPEGNHIAFKCPPDELVRRVTTDPRMGPQTHTMFKSYLQGKHRIATVHSTLYERNDPENFGLKRIGSRDGSP